MSFRLRLMLFTAVAIAATVAGASLALWIVAKHQLLSQVDQSIAQRANTLVHNQGFGPYQQSGLYYMVAPDGDRRGVQLPVSARARKLQPGASYYTDTTVHLGRTDRALRHIRFWIFLISGIGIAVAAGLAAFVAAAALRPVRRLTAAAESVAATGNLGERVTGEGSDELGRLATRFNEMLAALETSVGAQRRLVADASHELRTPLTAARTNVDLLREGKLPEDEAKRALEEASVELGALSKLVADLVELARGTERQLRIEDVQLDDLVAGIVERTQVRAPQVRFVTALSPTLVKADPVLLERAVSNLLDNAVKYSPEGAPVEVTVRGGEVIVADHGPGIAAEDLPRVFDRFYRAAAARSKPGSGLGLAIVREAAEAHGGTASAESTAAGARFKLVLPTTAPA